VAHETQLAGHKNHHSASTRIVRPQEQSRMIDAFVVCCSLGFSGWRSFD